MIEYNYDPWGKISYIYFDENGNPSNEIADESLQMITAIFCPLTYRGYNYDFTTGLYYLQSRYYNPEWGRFLNCDDTSILLATQGETHGANLFAYCNNDPVNKSDSTGRWAKDVHSGFGISSSALGAPNGLKINGIFVSYNLNKRELYGTYWWAVCAGFSPYYAKKIGEYCNDVDKEYKPIFAWQQMWHFNTAKAGEVDSRIILMTFMYLAAWHCFDVALLYKRQGRSYKTELETGLMCLGYSLHPIQDYYAHTDDRVYDLYIYPGGVPIKIKSHVRVNDDTDSAIKRWGQLLKAKDITMEILSSTYKQYSTLFL